MKRSLKRTLAGSMAVLSGLLIQAAGPLAVSAHAAPPVVDLQTYGSSYGEFSARWWQWLLSIPRATSPILDTSGIHCGRGQVDDVWFLAGTFGATVTRSCTVPAGKPIFFPLVNTSVFKPYGYETILDLRAGAAATIDGVTSRFCYINGVACDSYRVRSPSFTYKAPQRALLPPGWASVAGSSDPVISDGYWTLLMPLSPGQHTVRFGGSTNTGFSTDTTYILTVQ